MHEPVYNRCVRISTVYLLFGYTLVFILFWTYITSTALKFGWILSPFGLTLAIFASLLYYKSYRLKMGQFRLSSLKSHTKHQLDNLSNLYDQKLLDPNENREAITSEASRRTPINTEKIRVS